MHKNTLGEMVFLISAAGLLFPAGQALGMLLWYEGAVEPDAPNSAGPGLSWTLAEGNRSLGSVVDDINTNPDIAAIDGKAFRINDAQLSNLSFRGPYSEIAGTTGATVVARIKLPTDTNVGAGPLERGENIMIFDGEPGGTDGITAGMHWSGIKGKEVREGYRGVKSDVWPGTPIGNIASRRYHVIRMTSIDTGGADGIVVRLYFDEAPTPLVEIKNAMNVQRDGNRVPPGLLGDAFGFGVSDSPDASSQWDVYFDWVTASDAGAFAPGDEVGVIGRSLVVPEPASWSLLAIGLCAVLRRRR
jgi:hypothetical protein